MSRRPLFPPVFSAISSRPMVDDFTLRAARQRSRTQPPGVPTTMILPTRESPLWSGNNELGREAAFQADANNRQMILKLGEWGEPEVWSLMLGIDFEDTATGLFGITAEIRAGNGGTIQTLEVDWLQGTTLSLVMNAVDVTAKYAASPTSVPSNLLLRATTAKGKVSGRPPVKTVQVPALVTGGGTVQSAAVRIPPFTKSFMVLDRGVAANGTVYSANFSVLMRGNSAGSQVGEVTGDVLLNFASNGYPISDFARYLVLEARNPIVAVTPTIVFFLGL